MDVCNSLEDYLITYRNIPLENIGQSPSNLVQNRVLKTKLPIRTMQVDKNNKIQEKKIENQETRKRYFDQKGTVKEMVFEEGEKVWLQDKFNKTWNVATIIKKLEIPRCYLVRDEKGKLLKRNIFFLRKRKTLSLEVDVEGGDREEREIKNEKIITVEKVRRTERQSIKPDRLMYN